jgi:hypothetical protein
MRADRRFDHGVGPFRMCQHDRNFARDLAIERRVALWLGPGVGRA